MMEDTETTETVSRAEITRILAEATDSDPEAIRDGSEEFDVAPPWVAEVEETE